MAAQPKPQPQVEPRRAPLAHGWERNVISQRLHDDEEFDVWAGKQLYDYSYGKYDNSGSTPQRVRTRKLSPHPRRVLKFHGEQTTRYETFPVSQANWDSESAHSFELAEDRKHYSNQDFLKLHTLACRLPDDNFTSENQPQTTEAAAAVSLAWTLICLLEALALPLSSEWIAALKESAREFPAGKVKHAQLRLATIRLIHEWYDRWLDQYTREGHCYVADTVDGQEVWRDAGEEYTHGEFHSPFDLRRSKSKATNAAEWTTEPELRESPYTLEDQVEAIRRKWRGSGPDDYDAPSGARILADHWSHLMDKALNQQGHTARTSSEDDYHENKKAQPRPKSPKLHTLKRTGQPTAKVSGRYKASKAEWDRVRGLSYEDQRRQFSLRKDAAANSEAVMVRCLRASEMSCRMPKMVRIFGSCASQLRDRGAKSSGVIYDYYWCGMVEGQSEPTPVELRWSITRFKKWLIEAGCDCATANDPAFRAGGALIASGAAQPIDVLDGKTERVRVLYSRKIEKRGGFYKFIPAEERAKDVIVPRGLCDMDENGQHVLSWFVLNELAPSEVMIWRTHQGMRPLTMPKHAPGYSLRRLLNSRKQAPAEALEGLKKIILAYGTLECGPVKKHLEALAEKQAIKSKPMPRKRKWTGQKWGVWWRLLTPAAIGWSNRLPKVWKPTPLYWSLVRRPETVRSWD